MSEGLQPFREPSLVVHPRPMSWPFPKILPSDPCTRQRKAALYRAAHWMGTARAFGSRRPSQTHPMHPQTSLATHARPSARFRAHMLTSLIRTQPHALQRHRGCVISNTRSAPTEDGLGHRTAQDDHANNDGCRSAPRQPPAARSSRRRPNQADTSCNDGAPP